MRDAPTGAAAEQIRRPMLRKELGQHHLRSGSLVRPLVDYLDLQGAGLTVVEIGPGGGILTVELLQTGARVMALELDKQWAFALDRRLRSQDLNRSASWALAVGDALDLNWGCLGPDQRVAGNLPYGVATAILRAALAAAPGGLRLALLVQLEVAQRICAAPGDTHYGALSVQVRARTGGSVSGSVSGSASGSVSGATGEVRQLGRVKPGSFIPPPKVESAFVGLSLAAPAVPFERWPAFCDLVFAGFSQRRKTLRNALSARFLREDVEAALEQAGVGPLVRAQELDVELWVRLFERLGPA